MDLQKNINIFFDSIPKEIENNRHNIKQFSYYRCFIINEFEITLRIYYLSHNTNNITFQLTYNMMYLYSNDFNILNFLFREHVGDIQIHYKSQDQYFEEIYSVSDLIFDTVHKICYKYRNYAIEVATLPLQSNQNHLVYQLLHT